MRVDAAFPSKYLKSSDLNGQSTIVTMSNYATEEVGPRKDEKLVLYFQGKQKGMILNKTNAETIAAAYGPEMDHWLGERIELFAAMVEFQGKSTEGLRVRIPSRKAAAQQSAPRQQTPAQRQAPPRRESENPEPDPDDYSEGFDKEIPF